MRRPAWARDAEPGYRAMDLLQFLTYRAAFTPLPFGEIQAALGQVRHGHRWSDAFREAARRLRWQAEQAEVGGRFLSAAQAWQWVASACQVATFGLPVEPEERRRLRSVARLRRMARIAYLRALRLDAGLGRPVMVPCAGTAIHGYLRLPVCRPAPLVLLLNGLDSVCEVELHAFGTWLQAHGLGALALDLPAASASRPRRPCFAVEQMASAIADWASGQLDVARGPLGLFGVSFGGHLVARMLAGDARFAAGVAVSPVARLGPDEFRVPRIRRMFAWTFDLPDRRAVRHLAATIRLDRLPSPKGRLLVYHMQQDHLFGPAHVQAFCDWGGEMVEVRRLCAEHVGTSLIHRWLPEACDWLADQLHRAHKELTPWATQRAC